MPKRTNAQAALEEEYQRRDCRAIQVRCLPEEQEELARCAEQRFSIRSPGPWLRLLGLMIARGQARVILTNQTERAA